MVVWKSLSKNKSLKLTRSKRYKKRRYKSRRSKSRNVRLGYRKSRRHSRTRSRKTRTRHRRQYGGYKQFQSNIPRSLGFSLGGNIDPAVPGTIAQATHAPSHTYKKCGSLL